jgi:hypothetical protein
VRRLADEVAAAMGRETHTETIAVVTRAALQGTYAEVLRLPTNPGTVEIAEASPDGVEVSFRCPRASPDVRPCWRSDRRSRKRRAPTS